MTNAMKVHVLDCGAMGTDMEQLLGAPPYRASRHDHHKAATWISASLHTVLIEHPEGLLLWDTAVNRNWEQTWAGTGLDDIIPYDEVVEAQYLDSRLRQLGYEANDIDTVIFSHLHMDHAGNAKLFNNGHTRLLCHEEELAGATSFTGANLGGHIKAEYDGLKFDTVRGDTEILPGITLYETPGHTWGQMSLRLDLDHDGPMIFTSDAIYLSQTIEHRHWGAGVFDNRAWLASVDKILGIAERDNATLVFGHDSAQLKSLRLSPDGYYS
jgi:N-acyl homoserine lactone hydrolase